jgi:aerobic C4-dicarboxylate transport protein
LSKSSAEGELMAARRRAPSLYAQVLIATAVGVLIGHFLPKVGVGMKPIGVGFIKAIRMIVAPVVFCTVVAGIAGIGDLRTVGKGGVLALLYFEAVSTAALLIGLAVANLARPGGGMNVDPAALDSRAVAEYVGARQPQGIADLLLGSIPSSVADAFVRSDMLQVLFVAILFGCALSRLGPTGRAVVELVEGLSRVVFGIVDIIMIAAPLGALSAMAATIGSFGVGTLAQLGKLIACFYATCALFIGCVLGGIAWLHGFSLWRFIQYIRDELLIAFGTSSSESVLPRLMAKLEGLGAERSVVGLVVPAGYSFNLDGTAIYLSMTTLFIAQATNTPFTLPEQVVLLAVLLLTSKGSAGVAGAALVVLAGTLSAAGHLPVAGVALVLGIHRFMGEAMAVTNVIGNGVAAIIVGRWTRQLDVTRLRSQLREAGMQPAVVSTPIGQGRAIN